MRAVRTPEVADGSVAVPSAAVSSETILDQTAARADVVIFGSDEIDSILDVEISRWRKTLDWLAER